jgi:hypothetical protein
MAVDLSGLTDYTWAQIRLMAKHAIMSATLAGAELRTPTGQSIKRITVDEAKALYQWAYEMEAIDDGENGNVLAEFGER